MKTSLIVTGIFALSASAAFAGPIDNACRSSGREAASPALCGCIQVVANQTLTRRDQRVAATFFRDPHLSQELRQSDNRSDEKFWLRYKAFGAAAAERCTFRS